MSKPKGEQGTAAPSREDVRESRAKLKDHRSDTAEHATDAYAYVAVTEARKRGRR